MASLSAYYPQPVVAGTTAGTYAEGNDSRISQLGAGSVVTSTGSTTARSLANRFAEEVNIKDFGAVGDGITDDWLAIQRAIYAAAFETTPSDAATITISDTVEYGGVQVPKLYVAGQGHRKVIFPKGSYYISRSLVVTHGTQLWGDGSPDKAVIYVDPYGQYNAIESFGIYFVREFWQTATEETINQQAPDFFSFLANLQIHNLNIRLNPNTKPVFTRSGTTATVTLPFNHNWEIGDKVATTGSGTSAPLSFINSTITGTPELNQIQFTVANSGASSGRVYVRNVTKIEEFPCSWYPFPMNSAFARVSSGGSSGSSSITVNKIVRLSVGNKIRFSGGNDEYTITNISGSTTLSVTPNFSRNVQTNEILLIGLPAQNGIAISGGEDSMVGHCYTGEMQGAGILIYGSSPATVVLGCMSNQNYAGYWLDGAINGTFIKPSGDANYIFFKLGSVKAISNVLIDSMKMEDFAGFPSRCVFQAYGDASGSDPAIIVNGGSVNEGAGEKNRSMIESYTNSTDLSCNFIGFFAGSYGGDVIRRYNKYTGALIYKRGRTYPSELTNFYAGNNCLNIDGLVHKSWPESAFSIKTYVPKDSNLMANGGGILGDLGTNLWTNVNFERTGDGTVMELDVTSHGLVVGDYVSLVNTQNYSPWIGYTQSGSGDPAYFNGSYFKVQSVVNANKITITVLDQGPSDGICDVKGMSYWYFHQIRNGAHVFQMPNQTLPTSDKSMVKFISRNSRTQLSGLNVPALDTGEWWAKDQFTLGGTVSSPQIRFITGTNAPSASAPDGSLYLRTDGTADTTLYVRAGGSWTALTST